ncbi:MAG: hypothetical protein ACYSUI_03990 [Planctomycetota bacterium]|jgi:hypothetical protein
MRIQRRALLLLAAAGPAFADVVAFEASSFPEQEGWSRITYCTPERSIQDGWLHQAVEPGQCGSPPGGDRDLYARSIADFDGAPTFFVEWRIEADGDRSELPWGAPAVLSAWSQGPVTYWFAIARDQVEFVQDDFVVVLYVDLEPGLPHTLRLELYGARLYVWYIDTEIVHSDVPGALYPSYTPSITWGAQSAYLESNVKWDYIRYGTIPEPGSGDYDSDGTVDLDDLYFFQECLSNGGPETDAGPGCRFADFDDDTDVDLDDYAAFAAAFTTAP